jgi:hypothetical protein
MLDGGNVMRAWFAKDEWPQTLIPECILWPQPCDRPRLCPVDCTLRDRPETYFSHVLTDLEAMQMYHWPTGVMF